MKEVHLRQRILLRVANLKLVLVACCALALTGIAVFTLVRTQAMTATTFVVTNTNDSGPGSLRQAMLDANANPGTDVIAFNLPGPSLKIQPVLSLSGITDPVVIDGTTQPGFAGVPIVELNGDNSPSLGLFVDAKNRTIRGLVINGFHLDGIALGTNSGSDRVEGCYIGTDITGKTAVPNGGEGIGVFSSNNIIGGTTPAARNVISGNLEEGIQVTPGSQAISGNVILGNFIGVSADGDKRLANQREGIFITGATRTTVGGTLPGARNVVSGNHFDGILLGNFSTTDNVIQGNFIGTDLTGTKAIPNDRNGISIDVARNSAGIGGDFGTVAWC